MFFNNCQFMELRKIKIGFINGNNPLDRKASSGVTFQMYQAFLRMGMEVIWIPPKITLFYKLNALWTKFLSLIKKERILVHFSERSAVLKSRTLDKKFIEDCDVLFAPFASSSIYLLQTEKPLVYLADGTFAAMVDYYYKGLSKRAIEEGNNIELMALEKATCVVMASDWAKYSAMMDYHIPEQKIHVIEFGANIDDEDIVPHRFQYRGQLNLLFLGVDWIRKGGDIAVDACRCLNKIGIPSTLHIVGIRNLDKDIVQLPFVKSYGFLDKNKEKEYDTLVNVIRKSHCLLLPTKAECAGIAFCESSANGLPVFTYNTGGVANYVIDGRNGYKFPLVATGKEFAEKIKSCLESGELERMSFEAVSVYKERLNWQVWGEKFNDMLNDMIRKGNK